MKSIVRAWKDPIYRASLSAAQRAELSLPAGMIELTGTDLDHVAGGGGKHKGSGSGKSGKSSGSGKSGSRSGKSSKSGGSGKSGKSGKC
jgi:mersacidin/lichenicidin family type 2 lantibiotic